MSFFVELWNSIFTPGTTPQLIIATHASFIALFATLAWLIFVTKGNIHFIALLLIAVLLWLSIIWFIHELKNVKLQDNKQLEGTTTTNNNDTKPARTGESTAVNKKTAKSRKV